MSNNLDEILARLGLTEPAAIAVGGTWRAGTGATVVSSSPIDRSTLASFSAAGPTDVEEVVGAAHEAFLTWRTVPAPVRGELVRRIGDRLRQHKEDLAAIVTLEAGKIIQESLGEVQEMIDICDFAVGQSRQLYGLSIASERPEHRLTEQWHPLGPIGVISAFNFPVAVWAWNAMLGLVCGDTVIWKPSEKTPLSAMATHALVQATVEEMPEVPSQVMSLIVGDASVGEALAAHHQLPLISATGSVPMGRAVAQTVAARLGRSLLELGGNNAMILAPSADLDAAVRAIVFSAVGTCGQRCTSLRRLIVHETIAEEVLTRILKVYNNLPIGDPRDAATLVGPLVDEQAASAMEAALETAVAQGGQVHGLSDEGSVRATTAVPSGGCYVRPVVVEIDSAAPIVQQETFAPILYVLRYSELAEAIDIQNEVPQGLSSAIFTADVREAERFCSPVGSDCGIANVNIGTSGAEIGGAFGGEKETGGGRESGSDAWRNYMRRQTNTINYGTELPLAQGIQFDI